MSFRSHAIITTFFMAWLGIASLLLIGSIDRFFIFASFVAVMAALFMNLRSKKLLSKRLWNLLAVPALVFFIADYFVISKDLIAAGARFLAILLALKLFDLKSGRDHIISYALVFLLISACASSTVNPAFFLILFLFIIGSVWGMILLNLKKDRDDNGLENASLPGKSFGSGFFAAIALVSLASLFFTLVLFFSIPRLGAGFFHRLPANSIKVSGFSDKVDLGSFGEVKKDPTVIMRVGLKKEPSAGSLRYFKGSVLDTYNGKSWTRSSNEKAPLDRMERLFRTDKAPGWNTAGLMEHEIILEPIDTDIAITASRAIFIEGKFQNLWADSNGAVYLPSAPSSRLQYTVWSDPGAPEPYNGGKPFEAAYTDTEGVSVEVRNLALEIVKEAYSPAEKAQAIKNWLSKNISYSLETNESALPPLENFLFNEKKGYCEHFATAMAIMLRASGVPSRLVTGFLHGEWNRYGNYLIVRQQDAHSWVEAYIDGKGWVTYDPTPSSQAAPSRLSGVSMYLDLMRWRWNRYIIQFSSADQRKAAEAIEAQTSDMASRIKSLLKNTLKPGKWLLPAVILMILAVAVVFALRKAGVLKSRRARFAKTPLFYEELLKTLEKKGLKKKENETPLEFAERTGLPEVLSVTDAYHKVRYGGKKLGTDELSLVEAAVRKLRQG